MNQNQLFMEKLFVYRINNGGTNLDNTNVGNLERILSYLAGPMNV
jgi:hypothetical protein